MQIKFLISSNISYINKTKHKIVNSLVESGVDINNIYIFVGGYDKDYGYQKLSEDLNIYSAPHSSFEYNGLISVIEQNIKSDFWFLLHDTCYVGPNFYKNVLNYDYKNASVVRLNKGGRSSNIASMSWDYIQQIKDKIMIYKNTNLDEYSLQKLKKLIVDDEDKFLFPSEHYYCESLPRILEPVDFYGNGVLRQIENYFEVDLYKIKANWFHKPNWELKV